MKFMALHKNLMFRGGGIALICAYIFAQLPAIQPEVRHILSDSILLLTNGLSGLILLHTARQTCTPAQRLSPGWLALSSALLLAACASLIRLLLNPGPDGWSGMLLFASGILFLIAILLFPSSAVPQNRRADILLYAGPFLLAGFIGLWSFLIMPYEPAIQNEPFLIQLAFWMNPGSSLMILAAVVLLIFRPLETPRENNLTAIFLGYVILFISSSIACFQYPRAGSTPEGWVGFGFLLSPILLAGAAMLQPVPAAESTPVSIILTIVRSFLGRMKTWRDLFPLLALVGGYLILVWRGSERMTAPFAVLELAIGLLIVMAIIRQVLVTLENERLNHSLNFSLDQLRIKSDQVEETARRMQVEIVAHQQANDRLSYETLHDSLTGLPNRTLFLDRLTWAAKFIKRHEGSTFAVLYLNCDHFKAVNDSMGHTAGDQLLVETSYRLIDCLRASDTVARIGGDEFVMLLSDPGSDAQIVHVTQRIQEAMRQPFDLNGRKGYITVSIGIVPNIKGYDNAEEILRDADIAMVHAKNMGKARHEFFHIGMLSRAISQLEIEHDLRTALERNEMEVHYQPIILLEGERLAGFEALLRWKHPRRGMIPPAEFIPVAEECGMIMSIGRWVLREACRQVAEWKRGFLTPPSLFISVNISAHQFNHPGFGQEVEDALRDSGLDSSSLKLEITESIFLKNSDAAVRTFQRLANLGVECEIDDFGTGFSALNYLQNFPIHTIKIDRSFIQRIQPKDRSGVVHAIMAMSKDMKIQTIAEGLETEMQLDELRAMGCLFGQGYFFYKAMNSRSAEELMAGGHAKSKRAHRQASGQQASS